MKNFISLFIVLLLSACAPDSPLPPGEGAGVRETSTPPSTQTPIPTPTFHPAFVEMQTRLADLGLTLLPDGKIQMTADGGRQTVLNLFVSPEGVISLTLADGTVVSVDPEDMSVDDKGGLTIKGYELDENGEWIVAANIVKLDKGITLTLEDADGDGISEVVEVSIDNDDLSAEQKEFLVNQLNPGYVGFTPDEARLYYDAEKQTYWVGSADDPSNVIARQDSETGRLIWDYDKMKDENGESILFRIAHTWEMKGVNPVDMESAKVDSRSLFDEIIKFWNENGQSKGQVLSRFYVYNNGRNLSIGGNLWVDSPPSPKIEFERIDIKGEIFFLDKEQDLAPLLIENFDCTNRFWN